MDQTTSFERRIARLEDAEAIRHLKNVYARLCDDGMDPDELLPLYAGLDDDEWSSNVFGSNRGHDEIHRHFAQGVESLPILWAVHFMTNPMIEVAEDGQAATGDWTLLEFNLTSGQGGNGHESVVISGRYRDSFVKVDGRWKFHKIHLDVGQLSALDQGWARQPNRGGDPADVAAGRAAGAL